MQLSAQSVELRYGSKVVLESFSHTFKSGAWTHIVGPNGAGKSTLLKALCGLLQVSSGRILLDDRCVTAISPDERAKYIAYVPQQIESLPPVTASELVAQGLYVSHFSAKKAIERARMIMAQIEIAHLSDRRITELSGGELQLCVLASAIAQDAGIILLDEPTKGLDLRYQQMLMQILDDLRRQGRTVISVTHDLSIARHYADQTILLAERGCMYQGDGFPSSQQIDQAYCVSGFEPQRVASLSIGHSVHSAHPKGCVHCPAPVGRRQTCVYALSLVVLVACLAGCPFWGATEASLWDDIFWTLRVPRVIWGAVAGGVLALVGATFQALFQNPLATPYTLGVASGASLGAMIAIQFGIGGILGLSLSACAGGILSMGAVMAIASRRVLNHPFYCLMAGVAASMFCSAMGMVVQSFATPLTAQQMMRWQMGGFEIVGYEGLVNLAPIAIGFGILIALAHPLNLMSVDNDLAASRGVGVMRTRMISIAAACVITSIVVSVCGPIGFVGLIIPNAVRHVIGADLRHVMPIAALWGASVLVIADTISRILERFAWIPAGVVTAVIGVPCFMYLLFGRRRE